MMKNETKPQTSPPTGAATSEKSDQLSQDLIQKIRDLPAGEFEVKFVEHLRAERRLSLVIVYFMRESYRRRTWSKNYPSFSKYCTERLKMSETDFYRKFSIMKTIEEMPEVETKLIKGDVQPSTVAKMGQFFYRESKMTGAPISVEQKREVFKKMEGLSHRQVERELAALSPQSAIPDKTRQISEKTYIRQFTSNQELETKITRAKELLSHSLPPPSSDCQLFTKVLDITLEKIDPIRKDERRKDERRKDERRKTQANSSQAAPVDGTDGASAFAAGPAATSRHIPADTKRFVLMRDGYACTHINPESGEKCGSRWALELDHIRPFAQGGDHSPENLRTLCRTHNQLRALETYGRHKMSQSIPSLR